MAITLSAEEHALAAQALEFLVVEHENGNYKLHSDAEVQGREVTREMEDEQHARFLAIQSLQERLLAARSTGDAGGAQCLDQDRQPLADALRERAVAVDEEMWRQLEFVTDSVEGDYFAPLLEEATALRSLADICDHEMDERESG